MKKISVYLAGNIQKGHENESQIFWSEDDIKKLKQLIAPNEIIFLNPSTRSDDLSDQRSVFGRDMSQVFLSDIILVDARERRGLGVGAEMMWAKMNQIYVVTLAPKNSHYNKDSCTLLGQTVENWIHPFIESLSDVVVEDLMEMSQAILNICQNEPVSKNKEWIFDAMRYYKENQLYQDLPMNKLIEKHPLLQNRFNKVENQALFERVDI